MEMLTNFKACNQTARYPVIFFPRLCINLLCLFHFFLSTKGSQLKGNYFHVFPASVKSDDCKTKLHINARCEILSPSTTSDKANVASVYCVRFESY